MSDAALVEGGRLSCFKSYDVRGEVGRNLDADIAFRIGRAFAKVMSPQAVVIGRDCRLSGEALGQAFARGVASTGAHVFDIGVAGTEEVYHAVQHLFADAGAAITASHNPASDNGIKFIGPGCRPLTEEEYASLRKNAERSMTSGCGGQGSGRIVAVNTRDAYAAALLGLVDAEKLRPLKVVANAGNGVAGAALDAIVDRLEQQGRQLEFIRLNHAPDGRFPNGVPNPLLPSRRSETGSVVRQSGADFGVAWDGDFDRCFLFDETGAFVDGAHLAALLAASMAAEGEVVLHDKRIVGPMSAMASAAGAEVRVARTGHVHMKRAMRETGAIYGGEMSGHHYFRAFRACDSGMLPWLKVAELMGKSRAKVSELVGDIAKAHPVSGELNYRADSPRDTLQRVEDHYSGAAADVDKFDGLSLTFDGWRMNLRASSTEPVMRLNLETFGDHALLAAQTEEVDRFLVDGLGCSRLC